VSSKATTVSAYNVPPRGLEDNQRRRDKKGRLAYVNGKKRIQKICLRHESQPEAAHHPPKQERDFWIVLEFEFIGPSRPEWRRSAYFTLFHETELFP
jgi:hypothetical protein